MDNVNNNQQQNSDFNPAYKTNKLRKISTMALMCLLLMLIGLMAMKYLPNKENTTKQINPIENTQIVPANTLSFSRQDIGESLSKYDHALLASPDVLSAQKDKFWQPLECLHAPQEKDWYTIADIKKDIKEETLLRGLQDIENNKFKITVQNKDGALVREYTSLKNIDYTEICKDSENYYVLFLTTSDRTDKQGSLFVPKVKASGGWLGISNFAVISFSGVTQIYENINNNSKNIAVNDLLKIGFTSPNSRGLAYYSCHSIVGKLDKDLYAMCGGEGGNGLYKINLSTLKFSEVSFCWWFIAENTMACYDKSGKRYYQYKYGSDSQSP